MGNPTRHSLSGPLPVFACLFAALLQLLLTDKGLASAVSTDVEERILAVRLSERPRLFIDKKKIQELKQTEDPFARSMLDSLLATLPTLSSRAAMGTFASRERAGQYGHILPSLALAYRLTGKDGYLDELKSRIRQLVSASTWKEDGDLTGAWILFGMACAYDWLHTEFDPDLKNALREKIAWQADIFCAHIENNSIFWARKYYNNHCHIGSSALAAAGLALYGDHPRALEYLRVANRQLEHLIAVLPPDGSWHEGVAYWSDTFVTLMRHAAIDQKAFGTNHLRSHPWFRNVVAYRQHVSLPGMNEVADFGDSPRSEKYLSSSPGLFRLASEFNDGVAQRLATNGAFDRISWLDLVWYDAAVKETPESSWDRRSAYLWDQGFFFWRTDWSSEAVFWGMKAGPPMGHTHFERFSSTSGWAHAHPDAGHLSMHAGGKHLLIDDGYVLRKRTSNHNVPLIDGIGQRGENSSGKWFDGRDFFKAKKTARITKVTEGKLFILIAADLTGSYKAEAKITSLKRHFLILNDGTGVVVDTYALDGPKEYRSLFHAAHGTIRRKGDLLRYEADKETGFFLKPLSGSPVVMSYGPFSIPKSERHQSNDSGMLVSVSQTGSSGRVFTVVEPFLDGEQSMRWEASLSGDVLRLENRAETITLLVDCSRDLTIRDGKGRPLPSREIPAAPSSAPPKRQTSGPAT
jgi:hypothetical protein